MKKVLVIEDTPDVQSLILETLRLHGFHAIAADDGQMGVELARRHLPDLILCDVNMPKMNGYEALATLRKEAATAALPFIFLTGVSDRVHMRKGMELGADDYLPKPFTVSELMAAVNARLEKQAVVEQKTERKLEELRGNIRMALPHELRTPLNGILGLAQILRETNDAMKVDEVKEAASHIYDSALRLHRLVEHFLVYTQIELIAADSEKFAMLTRVPAIPVGEIIYIMATQAAQKMERENDLKLNITSADLKIPSENLQKIVEELTNNAFKFSSPGTPVEISTSLQGEQFHLLISDHGRGMTHEEVTNIGAHMQFERKLYEQQGTGLGLIIAKRLAELHGGNLKIQSVPGNSTSVEVVFPLPAQMPEN